jgi:hypothetical protein
MNLKKSRKATQGQTPVCALARGGKSVSFDFGPAKHASPIDWFVQNGQQVPVKSCRAGAGRIEDDKRRGEEDSPANGTSATDSQLMSGS